LIDNVQQKKKKWLDNIIDEKWYYLVTNEDELLKIEWLNAQQQKKMVSCFQLGIFGIDGFG
jgi:hypothetical protein